MDTQNASANALLRAIEIVGSQSALGRAIGRSQALIHKWIHSPNPLGAEHCLTIERATGGAVTRRDLRPDDCHLIWPDLADEKQEAKDGEAAHG